LATEKDSELYLKPWFDSNRRRALYDWMVFMMALVTGAQTIRDLEDVTFPDGDSYGMVPYNNPLTEGLDFRHPYPVVAVNTPTYTITSDILDPGVHTLFYVTGNDCIITINAMGDTLPRRFTVFNFTNDGTTIVAGLGVTLTGEATLNSQGNFVTVQQTGTDDWVSAGRGADTALALGDVSGVDITSPAAGQTLIYGGDSEWNNAFVINTTAAHPDNVTTGFVVSLDPGRIGYYKVDGASQTITIAANGSVSDQNSMAVFQNNTSGTLTFSGSFVTLTKPTNRALTCSMPGGVVYVVRLVDSRFFVFGDLDHSTARVNNTVVLNDGTYGEVKGSGVAVDNDRLYGYKAMSRSETGTTYTLDFTDTGKVITFNNASAITVTLPNSLPQGFACTCVQKGAGQVTFSAGSGATLYNRSGHTKIAGQYGVTTVFVEGNADNFSALYYLAGDTAS
jgi:hypothetical protein